MQVTKHRSYAKCHIKYRLFGKASAKTFKYDYIGTSPALLPRDAISLFSSQNGIFLLLNFVVVTSLSRQMLRRVKFDIQVDIHVAPLQPRLLNLGWPSSVTLVPLLRHISGQNDDPRKLGRREMGKKIRGKEGGALLLLIFSILLRDRLSAAGPPPPLSQSHLSARKEKADPSRRRRQEAPLLPLSSLLSPTALPNIFHYLPKVGSGRGKQKRELFHHIPHLRALFRAVGDSIYWDNWAITVLVMQQCSAHFCPEYPRNISHSPSFAWL